MFALVVTLLTAGMALLFVVSEKARHNFGLFGRFIVAFFLLLLEDKVWHGLLRLPAPLPRNLDEVVANPGRFERLMKANKQLKPSEKVYKITKLAGITSEPAKQLTAGSIRLFLSDGESNQFRELDVFCKFQTGRGMPRWLQAIRIAAEPGVAREVDFYSQVRMSVPVKTVTPIMCLKSKWFNYVLLVLEHVDLSSTHRVVNDADCATLSEVKEIVCAVSKMHARFASEEVPETSWIPAKQGLDFAKWVESFQQPKEKSGAFSTKVFGALRKHFETKPVTLVHGDCRPGNMMFQGANRDAVEGVVFADWEATNIGPFLWDFTYLTTLGWNAKSRREYRDRVLAVYISSLNADGVEYVSLAESKLDVSLLVLVLSYVSRTIRVMGFWDKQGNESKDQTAWLIRVSLALDDLDAPKMAETLMLETSDIVELQVQLRREVKEAVGIEEDKWEAM